MFANWMKRTSVEIDSGCIYISGAVEFDDRPGPVRDALVLSVQTWHAAMLRAIVQAKERRPSAMPTPTNDQMLFEIHGLILALHYEARFLQNPGSIAAPTSASTTSCAQRHADAPKPEGQAPAPEEPAPPEDRALTLRPGVVPDAPYNPPLRDMQFVMHEVLNVADEYKAMPAMPTPTPTPSTRCSRKAASSPPR
jgi:hypothetical protein